MHISPQHRPASARLEREDRATGRCVDVDLVGAVVGASVSPRRASIACSDQVEATVVVVAKRAEGIKACCFGTNHVDAVDVGHDQALLLRLS